jgi:hypothetical protein
MTAAPTPDPVGAAWAGAVVAVAGGGPSLTQTQLEQCKGKTKLLAIKDALRLAPWADALYFCDERWWEHSRALVSSFSGPVFTLENYALRKKIHGLRCLRNDGREGFTEDRAALRHGAHSGYQAVHLAAHLGARRILLLGMDMKLGADGRRHWFGEHPYGWAAGPDLYSHLLIPFFSELVAPLRARGVEVFNVTPGSALECFPKLTLEEALELP